MKLLAPGSTAPVVCGLFAGLLAMAGLDDPLLFIGCVDGELDVCGFVDWAAAAVARVDRTASVAKPRRVNVLLHCYKRVGSQWIDRGNSS